MLIAIPAWLVPAARSYESLLAVAFFLGLAGSAFPVGVGYVSRWTPPARQGSALGVYGLGNIGQSAAVFLGPLLAAAVGWQNVFRGMAVLSVALGRRLRPAGARCALQRSGRRGSAPRCGCCASGSRGCSPCSTS